MCGEKRFAAGGLTYGRAWLLRVSLCGVGIASYSATFSKRPRVEGADSDTFSILVELS